MSQTDFEKYFYWVLLAVSSDYERSYLTRPWVEDGLIIGTDGHRIHMVKTDRPSSTYNINGQEDPCSGICPPKISDIFKTYLGGLDEANWTSLKHPGNGKCKYSHSLPVVEILDRRFNARYVSEAFGLDTQMSVCQGSPDWVALYLKSLDGARSAIIMPFSK